MAGSTDDFTSASSRQPFSGQVPRHLAIIMDGNGRWAEARGLPRRAGHQSGSERLRTLARQIPAYGIQVLSVYAFSTENWKRSTQEVNGLMHMIPAFFERYAEELYSNRIRLCFAGEKEALPADVQRIWERLSARQVEDPRLTLCICLNYGGRREIIAGVKNELALYQHLLLEKLAALPPAELQRFLQDPEAQQSALAAFTDRLNEAQFASCLYQANLPDPDLIIRTGGERRLSNFWLWQSAYSEYYWTSCLWPDFDEAELRAALDDYASRRRRFGGRP